MVLAGRPARSATSPINTRTTVEALDLPPYGKVHDRGVDITVLHAADCPHVDLVRDRLRVALEHLGLTTPIVERLVTADDHAGFGGSPTVLIEGRDPFMSSGGCGPAR